MHLTILLDLVYILVLVLVVALALVPVLGLGLVLVLVPIRTLVSLVLVLLSLVLIFVLFSPCSCSVGRSWSRIEGGCGGGFLYPNYCPDSVAIATQQVFAGDGDNEGQLPVRGGRHWTPWAVEG